MTYLIDANVLSEPTKPAPSPTVVDWLSIHEGDFVVDSVVLGELCIGVLLLSGGRKRTQLQQWLDAVVQTIECLPWDAAVSRRWAKLVVELRRTGYTLPVLDSMIAATALEHGLTVATRNIRDFRKTGVKVVDPFA
jgi:predicted nucleic acid-binding protein